MQMANVSASFKHGMTTETSTVSAIVLDVSAAWETSRNFIQ
jgi:hypothetical protein